MELTKKIKPDVIQKLRNRQSLRFFNGERKSFNHFQINQKENKVYWERYESLDKMNWVLQNSYLTLKDVIHWIVKNKEKNKKNCSIGE